MNKVIFNSSFKYILISIVYLAFVFIGPKNLDLGIYVLIGISVVVTLISDKYGFVILVLTLTNFLGLYNPNYVSGFKISDCAIIISISSFLKYLYINKSLEKKFITIIIYILLLGVSILTAKIYFNQELIEGILSFRIVLCLLYIIPFSKKILDKDYIKELFKIFYILAFIALVLVFIQSFNTKKLFMNFLVYNRYSNGNVFGRIILHTSSQLFIFLFGIVLHNVNLGKKHLIINCLFLLLTIYDITFVSRTRIYIFALLCVFFLIFLTNKPFIFKNISDKNHFIIFYFLIISIVFIFLLNYKSFIGYFFNDISEISNYARIKELNHYLSAITNKLMGGGMINESTYFLLSSHQQGLYLTDIGVFAYYFYFGVIGLCLLGIIFIKAIIALIKSDKDNLIVIICLVIIISTLLTVVPIIENMLLFIILLSVLYENEIFEKKDSLIGGEDSSLNTTRLYE